MRNRGALRRKSKPAGTSSWTALVEPYTDQMVLLTIIIILLLAWTNRFLQDDAYISFRYAHNLVNGHGLVWNPGERVEGYTNFLWTIMIAGGMGLGVDPESSALVLGLLSLLVTLTITYRLSRLLLPSKNLGILTLIVLGSNYSFVCYATGGLETQLQTALCVATVYLCLRGLSTESPSVATLLAMSTLTALAVLTRMDSILVCGPAMIATCVLELRRSPEWNTALVRVLATTVPLLVLVGTWMLWQLNYYGDVFPNSFYLKVAFASPGARGLNYVHRFLASYLLYPLVLVAFAATKSFLAREQRALRILGITCALWVGYIIAVGGDFMEFRLFTPILPLIAVGIVWLSFVWIRQPVVQGGLLSLVVAGSIHHAMTLEYTPVDRIEPIRDLQNHLTQPQENWKGIGQKLGELFGDYPDVTIATTAAGAIPYFSGLRAIDMYGVNDAWVARNGVVISTMPGHQRMAPLGYLLDQRVNLIISHPVVLKREEAASELPMVPVREGDSERFAGAQVIEIPLDEQYKFVVLYLARHPVIDALVRSHRWTVQQVEMAGAR